MTDIEQMQPTRATYEAMIAANIASWEREQVRRIAAHATIRASCKICHGKPSAYGCDACRIAIAHVGVATPIALSPNANSVTGNRYRLMSEYETAKRDAEALLALLDHVGEFDRLAYVVAAQRLLDQIDIGRIGDDMGRIGDDMVRAIRKASAAIEAIVAMMIAEQSE